IVVFNKGMVQQVGTPREVYERPANLFVADFMGLVNRLTGTIVGESEGRVRVQIGPQVIEAAVSGAPRSAGDVTIVIRPEAIVFGSPDPQVASNILKGTVVESAFLGNIVDCHVD